jgi:hypothetical protein
MTYLAPSGGDSCGSLSAPKWTSPFSTSSCLARPSDRYIANSAPCSDFLDAVDPSGPIEPGTVPRGALVVVYGHLKVK